MIEVGKFFDLCQRHDIRVVIEYDVGRYVPGEFVIDQDGKLTSDEFQQAHAVQGPSGWNIEVDMRTYTDPDGKEKLYPTIEDAIHAGFGLLRLAIKEKAKR